MCFEEFLHFLKNEVDFLKDLEIEVDQVFGRNLAFLQQYEIISSDCRLVEFKNLSEMARKFRHAGRELQLKAIVG